MRFRTHGARGSHRRIGLALAAITVPMLVAASAAATSIGTAWAGPVHAGSSSKPLAGKIIGIDPGHNGRNWTDPSYLDHKIWNGREWEDCDTTGTETASGYTEARFNFNVAMYLKADLIKDGARVVLTRHNNHGIGPCVNRRARILDRAHANVSIDIHADYGPATGRGFTVLEPVADGPNDKVIKSSLRFGRNVHAAMSARTPMPISNYYGHNGYIRRDDLAGLNLTTMPKVLIECGNMNNAADARLLVQARVQRQIARALAAAIVTFLSS
ncbi:MAG TPA: N-acetylmuramoyl-L-alanine amidase [Streptosporangiaceae bacterium]|nr:N-acetylmuramoyl-L-alanine amidase [Streptosporangiaceae bacterium]